VRLRSRSRQSHENLYVRAEADLAKLAANGGPSSDPEAESVYRETLGVLRRMHAILEGVGDGVFVTDADGSIRLWNGAAERVIGTSAKRAVGHHCSRVLRLGVRERTLSNQIRPLDCSHGCALLAEFGDRANSGGVECTRSVHPASDQQLLVSVSAVKGCDGEVEEVVHSMRDITRLKEADDAKTMFLATASHELKTPLTVILGYTQTLLADLLDDEQKGNALRSIETRAQQLGRIVDRLLLTGRIESGRVLLELASVSPGPLIAERAESLALATGRSVSADVADDIDDVVADEQALTTVLDHLLDNAVKYSPDGGDIVVRAQNQGSSVVIEIIDHGIGMNADDASQCFDRFWQAEQTDVRRFGGTGVGLYIVKSYIEGMGGKVGVRSDLGQGSVFTLTLAKASEGAPKRDDGEEKGVGKRSMIQEFMRQLGVPDTGGAG
jgi:PAS domain S-box-containing protein